MHVLITGAAGFLGSQLVDRFLDAGHRVVGVDNFVTGSWRNLEHLEGWDDFSFIEHDVSNPLFLDKIIRSKFLPAIRQSIKSKITFCVSAVLLDADKSILEKLIYRSRKF